MLYPVYQKFNPYVFPQHYFFNFGNSQHFNSISNSIYYPFAPNAGYINSITKKPFKY